MLSKLNNIFLRDFLNISLYVYLIALTLGLIFIGSNQLFDVNTELLGWCFGLIFLVSLNYCKEAQFAHVATLTGLFLLYVFPRILTYLLAPRIVVFPFGQNVGTDTINHGLSYVLIGTVLLFAGLFSASLVFHTQRAAMPEASARPLDYPVVVFLVVLILVLAVQFYISVWVGISPYGKLRAESGNTTVQLMMAFFAMDSLFFVVAAICLLQKEVTVNKMVVTIIVGSFFFLESVISGARSAGLTILMGLLAIYLAEGGNFRLPLRKFAVIVGIVVGISVLTHPLTTRQRTHISGNYWSTKHGTDSRMFEGNKWGIASFNNIFRLNAARGEIGLLERSENSVRTIVNHLALIDYGILTVAVPGNRDAKDKYMNVNYAAKSILNSVPGTIFKEAELNTSRVVNIIYRGVDEEYVLKSGYFSEVWTIWGLFSVVFGWWGGLIALFTTGFVMEIIYNVGAQFFGVYSIYYRAWFLFVVPRVVYFSSGIDHTFMTVLVLMLQAVAMVVILSVVSRLYARIGRLSWRPA